ncbi:MAG: DASS family sodium-coupled anion symporter [SAR324 cluster bacterium]
MAEKPNMPAWSVRGARPWGLAAAVAALLVVVLLPSPAGLPVAGQNMLGILAFAVILWMTEALDYAVSAVLISALMAFLVGLSPNPAKPGQFLGTGPALTMALGGFANTALALVAAALFLAAAMQVTGLDRRIALVVLSRMGARTNRVVVGAILTGTVMAFFVPSTTARVACLVPITLGMIHAFGAGQKSRLAALLMITTVQTASIWNVGIKTAAAQNLVMIGFAEKILGATVTWLDWFIAAAPWAILMSVGLYFVMTWMLPPETSEIAGGAQAVAAELKKLGPPKPAEIKLMAIAVILLAFWATEGVLHPFDSSTTTVAAIAIMFLPGIGIMDWKTAQAKIPWGTILLFGVGIGLGTALLNTQAAGWLAGIVVSQLGLQLAAPLTVLAVLAAFLIVIHLGFASATALASSIIPIVIGVLQHVQTPGIHVLGMTLLLQFVVSFGFILPVNAPQNMVAYGTDTFTSRDFIRTGLVLTALGYALLLILSATYWRWLGYT